MTRIYTEKPKQSKCFLNPLNSRFFAVLSMMYASTGYNQLVASQIVRARQATVLALSQKAASRAYAVAIARAIGGGWQGQGQEKVAGLFSERKQELP